MDEKRETVPFLPEGERDISKSQSKDRSRTAYWILSFGTLLNVVLFFGAVVLYTRSRVENGPGPLSTDIKDAWGAVEYETRAFTGALKWSKEIGHLYREQDYDTEYFGPPKKELDAVWEELLHGELDRPSPKGILLISI